MNNYGNQFGVHSPNKTNEVISILNDKTYAEFEDVDDEANEEFNTFLISEFDGNEQFLETTDINKVIEFVNKRVDRETVCRNGKNWDKCNCC